MGFFYPSLPPGASSVLLRALLLEPAAVWGQAEASVPAAGGRRSEPLVVAWRFPGLLPAAE